MTEVMQHQSNKETGVQLTQAALHHITNYLSRHEGAKGIRLSVKKTGCSGLSYVVDYVLEPQDNDLVQNLNDSCQLFIDKASFPFLKGMTVDYVRQGLNEKFVFDNPNQKGQCGCGESFTV